MDLELMFLVKYSLSECLFDYGEYVVVLFEYVVIFNIVVEYGMIDDYVFVVFGMGNLCDVYGDYSCVLCYY